MPTISRSTCPISVPRAARAVRTLIDKNGADLPAYWQGAISSVNPARDSFIFSDKPCSVLVAYRYEDLRGPSREEAKQVRVLETWLRDKLAADPRLAQFRHVDLQFWGAPKGDGE